MCVSWCKRWWQITHKRKLSGRSSCLATPFDTDSITSPECFVNAFLWIPFLSLWKIYDLSKGKRTESLMVHFCAWQGRHDEEILFTQGWAPLGFYHSTKISIFGCGLNVSNTFGIKTKLDWRMGGVEWHLLMMCLCIGFVYVPPVILLGWIYGGSFSCYLLRVLQLDPCELTVKESQPIVQSLPPLMQTQRTQRQSRREVWKRVLGSALQYMLGVVPGNMLPQVQGDPTLTWLGLAYSPDRGAVLQHCSWARVLIVYIGTHWQNDNPNSVSSSAHPALCMDLPCLLTSCPLVLIQFGWSVVALWNQVCTEIEILWRETSVCAHQWKATAPRLWSKSVQGLSLHSFHRHPGIVSQFELDAIYSILMELSLVISMWHCSRVCFATCLCLPRMDWGSFGRISHVGNYFDWWTGCESNSTDRPLSSMEAKLQGSFCHLFTIFLFTKLDNLIFLSESWHWDFINVSCNLLPWGLLLILVLNGWQSIGTRVGQCRGGQTKTWLWITTLALTITIAVAGSILIHPGWSREETNSRHNGQKNVVNDRMGFVLLQVLYHSHVCCFVTNAFLPENKKLGRQSRYRFVPLDWKVKWRSKERNTTPVAVLIGSKQDLSNEEHIVEHLDAFRHVLFGEHIQEILRFERSLAVEYFFSSETSTEGFECWKNFRFICFKVIQSGINCQTAEAQIGVVHVRAGCTRACDGVNTSKYLHKKDRRRHCLWTFRALA